MGEGTTSHDSHAWVAALHGPAGVRDEALVELHELLLRGARFELCRSGQALSHMPQRELDDLAIEAADDALATILANLDGFRGTSRFTTWASKFALLDTRRKLRAAHASAATGAGTTRH